MTEALAEAYAKGCQAAYDHAANVAQHRVFLSWTLAPELAKAVLETMPDAIRTAGRAALAREADHG